MDDVFIHPLKTPPVGYNAIGQAKDSSADAEFRQSLRDRLAKGEIVPIRLNVVYEKVLVDDLAHFKGGIEKYVRNLLYATQLYFERPEIWKQVRIVLIPIGLKQMTREVKPEFTTWDYSIHFAEAFPEDYMYRAQADLNLVLLSRNIKRHTDPHTPGVHGVSNMGSFCHNNYRETLRVLTLKADGFALSSVVIAHEIAHSLNAFHDGDQASPIASGCHNDKYIMAPSSGFNKLSWSNCSIEAFLDHFTSPPVWECVFSPDRIRVSRPMNQYFDLDPKTRDTQLPGVIYGPREQCKIILGQVSEPVMKVFPRINNCQDLFCSLGPDEPTTVMSLGPSMGGSECIKLDAPAEQVTRCKNNVCVRKGKPT